jgi:uncharacterized protein (TIGR03083 family)
MTDLALYQQAMDTAVQLITRLSPEDLDRTCLACPAWSLRDVVSHHVHVVREFLNGNFPSSAITALVAEDDDVRQQAGDERDEWTQAGVEARRATTMNGVLDEWREIAARMNDESAGTILDLTMHLYDMRETLGDTTERTSPLIDDALARYYHWFLIPRLASGTVTVNLRADDTHLSLISDPQAPTVTGSAYELLRAVGGRRTRSQADATLDWGDTGESVRELFSVYNWPT